jgi:tRNA (cmo5U34)-methyltransferase
MKKDRIFGAAEGRPGDFEFDSEVAAVFDDMLGRSIPLYDVQQSMIETLAARFWIPGTKVYDLGCSTATSLIGISRRLPGARLIGYDDSRPMLEQARRKVEESQTEASIELRLADLNGPVAARGSERRHPVLDAPVHPPAAPRQPDPLDLPGVGR